MTLPGPAVEGESQLPQTPAAFNTPFFSRITIEKLIQTLAEQITELANNSGLIFMINFRSEYYRHVTFLEYSGFCSSKAARMDIS